MGKMKVFVFVILAISLAAMSLLAACAPEEAPPEEVGLPVPPGKLPTSEQFYYFIAANLGDPFYIDHLEAIADFAEVTGVQTEMIGPTDLSVAAQVKTFEEVMAKPGTAGIFLYPIEWAALTTLITEALDKGIPVTKAMYSPPELRPYTSIVGPDYELMCHVVAEYTAEVLNGEGEVATISIGTEPLIWRCTTYAEYLAEHYPNIEHVGMATFDGSTADMITQTQAFLGAHPEVDLYLMVVGKGGELCGLMQDAYPEIKFITFDKPQITLDAIKEGRMLAAVAYDNYDEAFWGMVLAYYAYHGFSAPEVVILKTHIITKDNVDQFLK